MIRLDEGGQQSDYPLIAAPAPLRHVVEHFWVQHSGPNGVRRIVPDPNAHVIFWTRREPRGLVAKCQIVGARSTFFDAHMARELTIGARLRPGVLPELVRDSAAQFTDRSAPLGDIAGRPGARLLEQMAEAPPREAVAYLAQFLSARLTSLTAPRSDLLDGVTSVFEMARALHRSRRSAYNRLTEAVGLAPKLALRIHRLHKALFELNQGRSLADAAATAAYSDQAHFSREAGRLLGEPPGVWQRRRHCSFVQDNQRPH
jgi:AraC-like DNA-binding protein